MKHVVPRAALIALLSCGMVFATACAPTRTQKSAGEVVDDAVVTSKVKAELAKDPATSAHDIHVETFRGIVALRLRR